MEHTFLLQVASTGETIRTGVSPKSAAVWGRWAAKKALRLKRTPERYRTAIAEGDIVVGWHADDSIMRELPFYEYEKEVRRIFRGTGDE